MPRPARRYRKRVGIWSYVPTDDSFAGKTLTESFIKDLWADVTTDDGGKSDIDGIERYSNQVYVFVRKDPDVDWANETLFVKIGGISHRILQKSDVDLEGIEVRLTIST